MEKTGSMVRIPKFQGVYFRESQTRRHQGKPDRCFYITFKDIHQKKQWEKVGWISEGYTAQMAAQIRGERIQKIRHGEEIPKRKVRELTLGEVWKRYDQWLDSGRIHPEDDRGRYKNHLEPRFANKLLSQISPFDLEKLKIELSKQGLAPATVKHCLVIIRQLFNKAIAWDLWKGENPIKKIKIPKLNNRRERFLTIDEAKILIDDLEKVSTQLRNMALLSLHTGMRASEIFALRWGHIDIINAMIHIADPKNTRSRKAYMTTTIKTMFQEINMGDQEELVFKSTKGEQIEATSRAFDRAVKRLGFNNGIEDPRQKVTFHTLRHTFASWLALRGTPILTIKELLGHQSLAMTERYAHLLPDHKQQAILKIEEDFTSNPPSSPDLIPTISPVLPLDKEFSGRT